MFEVIKVSEEDNKLKPRIDYKLTIDSSIITPPKKIERDLTPFYSVIMEDNRAMITCDMCQDTVKVVHQDCPGIYMTIIQHNRVIHHNKPYTVITKRN